LLSRGFGEDGLRFGLGAAFEVAGVPGVGVVTPLARPARLQSCAPGTTPGTPPPPSTPPPSPTSPSTSS